VSCSKEAAGKKRKGITGGEKEEKKTRRTLKDVEKSLNAEIEMLKQQLTKKSEMMVQAEEKVKDLTKRNDVLETENADFKNKSKIPEFFPNIRREIQLFETESMQKIDIEALEREDIGKICRALEKDWKQMHKREVELTMEEDEYALSYRCNIKQAIVGTALGGPDGFCYDAEALHKYIQYNKWETVFQKDVESGAVHMRVMDWRSPNTRQVWDEAPFSLCIPGNKTVKTVRTKVKQSLLQKFMREIKKDGEVKTKNMKEIADLFGAEIKEVHRI